MEEVSTEKKGGLSVVLCTVYQHMDVDRNKGALKRVPNIAIVSIMKMMERNGYSGDFYDLDLLLPKDEEIKSYFSEKQPKVVGISGVVSNCYQQLKHITELIRSVCPDTWIVLGGNMAVSSNLILRKTEVDVCVLGDGERPFVDFLDYVVENGRVFDFSKLGGIKGLCFLNSSRELIFTGYNQPLPNEDYPTADYDLYLKGVLGNEKLFEAYFRDGKDSDWFAHCKKTFEEGRKPKLAYLFASKGCVARCTFCQRFSLGYHPFDVEMLDNHIRDLKERFDVQFIEITGENFGLPKSHAYRVADIMQKYDMLWYIAAARCKNFSKEDLEYFKNRGLVAVKYGIETGSSKIYEVMEKMFVKKDIMTALEYCHDLGLWSPLGFCLGMPGETDETIKETGRFLGDVAKIRGTPPSSLDYQTFYALPLPGAALYDYAQLKGVVGTSVEDEEKYLIYVSDKGTEKMNFVNLTGQPIKKAIFWDFLMRYEATRTYYSGNAEKSVTKVSGSVDSKRKLKFSNLQKIFFVMKKPMTTMNYILSSSKLISKLPRSLIYIPMRNLLYLEYLVHKGAEHSRSFFESKGRYRINDHLRGKCKDKITTSESLRAINKKIRENLTPPESITYRNQRTLYLGRW
ncbi:B12-binding domain-containing radical SAM protein [Nanoarchaeota archaeon]